MSESPPIPPNPTFLTRLRGELEAATPWREVWYDTDRQALMAGSWPYGGRLGAHTPDATLIANAPTKLAALLDVAEAAQRFMDAADLRFSDGDAYFDAYHDGRHDLYQAMAALEEL